MVAVAFSFCESTYAAQHETALRLRDALLNRFGLDPGAYVFAKTKEGKPYAANAPFHFSISHSGALCCCAVSSNAHFSKKDVSKSPAIVLHPDPYVSAAWVWENNMLLFPKITGNIGIDIEKVDFDADLHRLEKIAKRYLHNTDAPLSADEFYRLWTRQEAYGKYTGEGFLARPSSSTILTSFRLQEGENTYFFSLAYSAQAGTA